MDNQEKLANKCQRILKGQSKMDNPEKLANKCQRILKGQSRMDNPEKLANKCQRKLKGQSRETGNIGHTRQRKTKQKTPHNMCWTPLYAIKHK